MCGTLSLIPKGRGMKPLEFVGDFGERFDEEDSRIPTPNLWFRIFHSMS